VKFIYLFICRILANRSFICSVIDQLTNFSRNIVVQTLICKHSFNSKTLFMQLTKVLPLLGMGVLSIISTLFAQNSLRVGDPRNSWQTYQGTVEEATFVVRPQGIYTSVDMYLTFSAKAYNFRNSDTLEVALNFELPLNSIVYDSWLWIDSTIIKADILDRWTASNIYENIVRRRRDPSILYRNDDRRYEMRIFPMAGDQSRRVKISYLTPMQWTATTVNAALPTNIPSLSINKPIVKVLTPVDNKWGKPAFANVPEVAFRQIVNELGSWWEAFLLPQHYTQAAVISHSAPLQDGVFLNTFKEGNGGIYQLVMLPKEAFGLEAVAPKKLLVLLDYTVGNSNNISQAEVLSQVKQQLLRTLSPRDSFNLILSKLIIKPQADRWIPATPAAIEATFAALGTNPISSYTNLPSMLGIAVDFIKNNGTDGSIVLFANSGQISNVPAANELIGELQRAMGNRLIPTYIADFQQTNYNWYQAGNRSFRGNEYFYFNLARITSGNYIEMFNCCKTLTDNAKTILEAATALTGSLDLYTRLQTGFCYSRFNLHTADNANVNFNQPVYQVGKYEGKLPFVIEAVGSLNGNLFSEQVVLQENDLPKADTLAQEIWAGNHIYALERAVQDNANVSKIISESISQRVLSRYTAFLALEPAQGGVPCANCVDQSGGPTVGVEELLQDSLLKITAAPNPFRDRLTLTLQFTEAQDLKNYQFAIYNLVGQQVKVFNDLSNTVTDRLELSWEAGADVPSGIYFFIIQSPHGRQNLKIVKL